LYFLIFSNATRPKKWAVAFDFFTLTFQVTKFTSKLPNPIVNENP
jgi:hypothetical protein